MKLTNSHAVMLLVVFLGCLNLSCGCKKPDNQGGSIETAKQSDSSGSSTSGGSATVSPPPVTTPPPVITPPPVTITPPVTTPPPVTTSPPVITTPPVTTTPPTITKKVLKVLIVPEKGISKTLYTSATNFIKNHPPTIDNTTIDFTIADSETDDTDYDKVMYVIMAMAGRLELYLSTDMLNNLKANKTKYITIPIQRIAKTATPPTIDVKGAYLFAPLRVPHGKDSEMDFQTTSRNTIDDFIKS